MKHSILFDISIILWDFAGRDDNTTRIIIIIVVPIVVFVMLLVVGFFFISKRKKRKPKEAFEGKFLKWPTYSSA